MPFAIMFTWSRVADEQHDRRVQDLGARHRPVGAVVVDETGQQVALRCALPRVGEVSEVDRHLTGRVCGLTLLDCGVVVVDGLRWRDNGLAPDVETGLVLRRTPSTSQIIATGSGYANASTTSISVRPANLSMRSLVMVSMSCRRPSM